MNKLTREHKNFLQRILQANDLKSFSENEEWYDFNVGTDVLELKRDGEYWAFSINEVLQEILMKGDYTNYDKQILNSVRMYYINKEYIV